MVHNSHDRGLNLLTSHKIYRGLTIRPHNLGIEWPNRRSSRAFSSIFRKSGLIGVSRATKFGVSGYSEFWCEWPYRRQSSPFPLFWPFFLFLDRIRFEITRPFFRKIGVSGLIDVEFQTIFSKIIERNVKNFGVSSLKEVSRAPPLLFTIKKFSKFSSRFSSRVAL